MSYSISPCTPSASNLILNLCSLWCSDPEAFALKKLVPSSSSSSDWVSQFNTLKALHRLLVKYANDQLGQPKLETPDLHKIAKNADEVEVLAFARIVVAIWSVQALFFALRTLAGAWRDDW